MSIRNSYAEQVPQLNALSPDQLPGPVEDYLAMRSGRFTDTPPLRPDEFGALFAAQHPQGVTSYVATQDKVFSADKRVESLIHVVDATTSGEVIGYGEVSLRISDNHPFFVDKPYIDWLHTEPAYRGTRAGNLAGRLAVLKIATESILGLPLYSDMLLSDSSRRLAQRLVRCGLAELVDEDGDARFRSVRSS